MTDLNQAKIDKLKGAIGTIWEALPIDQLLKARERMKKLHAEQLSEINAALTKKGYVEPHMVNVREHGSE